MPIPPASNSESGAAERTSPEVGNSASARKPAEDPVQELQSGRELAPATLGKRRSPWALIIVAALFIILPFLAWYFTWFGRSLSDETITTYLADQSKPRNVQHALTQIEARIEAEDPGARRWYPQIVNLAGSNTMEIRQTVAWVMGQDNRAEEFHAALRKLLNDPEPIVRRNAALGITRFNDPAGRPELIASLQPFDVVAPGDGILKSSLPAGSELSVGTLVARLKVDGNRLVEVRSPLPGAIAQVFLAEGAPVRAQDKLLSIAPDERGISESLLALRFVGVADDVATIALHTQHMSGKLKEQAALTTKAIQGRAAVQK